MGIATRARSRRARASSSERARRALSIAGLGLVCCAACDRCTDPPTCDSSDPTASVSGIWTIEGDGERAGCGDPRYGGDFELGPSQKLAIEVVSEPVSDGGARDASPADASPADASPADAARDSARDRSLDQPAPAPDLARDLGLADRGASDGRPEAGARDLELRPEARVRRDQRVSPPGPSYRHLIRVRNPPAGFSLSGEVRGSCVSFETQETDLRGTVRYLFSGKATSSRKIEGRFTGTGPVGCLSSGTFEVEIR
jgi:hypothetical protein